MNILKTFILAAAALVLAASCNKAEMASNEEITVNYSVSVPVTKALGEGAAVNKVWYAVYRTDGSLVSNYQAVDFTGGSANCPVVMMRGQSYKVVFVAQHYDGAEMTDPTYMIVPETAVISLKADKAITNSDNCDVFTYVDDVVNYDGAPADAVVLERKVSQISFTCNATDWNNAASLGMTPTHSSVTLTNVPKSYNLLSGTPSAETVSVAYAKNTLPGGDCNLATVFCFVGSDANFTTDATLDLYTSESGASVRTLAVPSVPAKANYKTNINGNIMTGSVNYSITIDPDGTTQNHPLS